MAYIYIHHTGCGTSRKGLALLQENGIEPEVRKYMNQAERLSVDELKDIAKKMGAKSPREFLREKNAKAAGLPDDIDGEELYQAMAADPSIIQRPIGIKSKKAVLGRPHEKLLEIV